MSTLLSTDFMWLLTAVQLPALAGLFWMVQHLREQVAAYKLEVARTYASLVHLKDVETRLTEHLVRIEAKLDRVATGARS